MWNLLGPGIEPVSPALGGGLLTHQGSLRYKIFTCDHGCLNFPGASAGKESAGNAGDIGSIPGLGRSPGEG